MRIGSDVVRGMAPISRADTEAGEQRRVLLEQPRLGRDLSLLKAHQPEETPLQYATKKVAELIVPLRQAIDGESPAGRPLSRDD
jgi:hypothetical protein